MAYTGLAHVVGAKYSETEMESSIQTDFDMDQL